MRFDGDVRAVDWAEEVKNNTDALALGVVNEVAYASLLLGSDDELTRTLGDVHNGAYAVRFSLFLSVGHALSGVWETYNRWVAQLPRDSLPAISLMTFSLGSLVSTRT